MNSDWPLVPVKAVCLGIFDGPHATPKKTSNGPIFLSIESLDSGRLDLSRSAHLSEEDFLRWTRRVTPSPGDVVFSYETRIGHAALVPSGIRCCLGRRLALMRADESRILPRYLLYAYLGPEFQETLRQRTVQGSTVDRIALTDFPDFPIRLPPLAEQGRIAGVLGVLDDKIEHNGELARRLSEVLSLMFRRLLSQPWESAPLGEQAEVMMGQSPPGATYSSDSSGLPLVQGMAAFGERFPSTEVFTSAPTKRARHGDVLMTVRAPVGEINVADAEYCAGRGVAVIRGGRPAYTEQLMRFLEPAWREHESGTIYPSVNRAQIVGVLAPKPSDHVVEEFETEAKPMYDLLGALARAEKHLTVIRDGLLPKLVSGAIRVPDSYDVDDTLGTVAEAAGVAVP